MASCELEVRLDLSSHTVRPGQAITGEVVAQVHEVMACKELRVVCGWFTRGRGIEESGEAIRVVLHAGALSPGVHRHRFTMAAPLGPLSCAIDGLSIGWRIEARVDLPWALDPWSEALFTLVADEHASLEMPYYFGPKITKSLAGLDGATVSQTPSGVKAAPRRTPWIFMGLVALVVLPYVPIFAALMAPFVAYGLVRGAMVKTRIAGGKLEVPRPVSCPGGTVTAIVELTPRGDITLEELHVELRGSTHLSRKSGKNNYIERSVVVRSCVPLAPPGTWFRGGVRVRREVEVPVPRDAPLTFTGTRNEVVWQVAVVAAMRWWPDWREELPVTIRPGPPRSVAAAMGAPQGEREPEQAGLTDMS